MKNNKNNVNKIIDRLISKLLRKSSGVITLILLIAISVFSFINKNKTEDNIKIENNNGNNNITTKANNEKINNSELKFIWPKEIKNFYVNNNYAVFVNDLKHNNKIKEQKELLFNDNNQLNNEFTNNLDNKEIEFYGNNLNIALGENTYINKPDESEIKKYLDNTNTTDINDFLNNIDNYIINENGQITALLTNKGFEDSKNFRGKFKENPLGWPNENPKIKNWPITNDKAYSGYLWNRSHLIADRFGGEATPQNSTTGTRTQNVGDNSAEGGGMVFVENAIAEFYKNGNKPFINIYNKTGFVPLMQVSINYYPTCGNFNNRFFNMVNHYNVKIKFYKLGVSDENQYLPKYCSFNELNSDYKKYIKKQFSFIYSDKYEKRNKLYNELFRESEKANGANIIIPNIINGYDFSYEVSSNIKLIEN